MGNNNKYVAGVIAGIVAGLAYGLMMALVGLTPLVAKMTGKESLAIEWMVNLVYSGIIGVLFVWWFEKKLVSIEKSVIFGLIHGIIWWVLGALTLRPLIFGLPLQYGKIFETYNMMFFIGHLIYGVVLGIVFYKMYSIKQNK